MITSHVCFDLNLEICHLNSKDLELNIYRYVHIVHKWDFNIK